MAASRRFQLNARSIWLLDTSPGMRLTQPMMITPTHNTSATAITPPAMSRTPDTSQAGSVQTLQRVVREVQCFHFCFLPFEVHQYQPVASEWAQAPQGDW